MPSVELSDMHIRVLDSVEVDFRLTRDQYLESFKVEGRIDLELAVDADVCNEVLDHRTPTARLGPRPLPRDGGDSISLGFVGLGREPRRLNLGDKEYLESRDSDQDRFAKIEGLPDSGIIRFDADLSNAELEDLARSSDRYRLSYAYAVDSPPLELIPVRIAGRFIRDYEEHRRSRSLPVEEEHVGKSSLSLVVTNTTQERPVDIEELRVSFAETFPRLTWSPRRFGQLLPEKRELVFSGIRIQPEQSENIDIITNLESVLQLGIVTGQLRAEIPAYTVSGLRIVQFFMPNGYPSSTVRRDSGQTTRVVANIQLDPRAMEEALLKSQRLVFNVEELPREVFDSLLRFFEASGYLLPANRAYGRPQADNVRANIWRELHKIDGVRRLFDDAVVRVSADVTGEWGEITEEREVESGGTRTEKGRRSTYGKTAVNIMAQSANEKRMNECLHDITDFFVRKGSE